MEEPLETLRLVRRRTPCLFAPGVPAAGGPLDIVKPGVTGLLFDPSTPGALRRSVGSLVADEAMRERMGASAVRKMADRSWAGMTNKLLDYYGHVTRPAWARAA